MLRTLAAADELPDEFAFRIRIKNLISFVALKSAGWSLVRRSDDGVFDALVHWMDEMLVREELLPLSSQLSPPHGLLFHE